MNNQVKWSELRTGESGRWRISRLITTLDRDAALVVNNRAIRPFPIDLFIAAVYWVCTYSMSWCARSLKKRIGPA
jgi:hypothetical protein